MHAHTHNPCLCACLQGAPEFVLRKCSYVLANNGEGAVPITDNMRQAILSDMQVSGIDAAFAAAVLAYASFHQTCG
jgi:hypothetical protein